MLTVMRILLPIMFLVVASTSVFAAPPPPPPDYIESLESQLSGSLTEINFGQYSEKFATDVSVYVNDHKVAGDKAAWLKIQKRTLNKVDRRVIGYSLGYNDIFIVDQIDDRSALPDSPAYLFDPRFITRAGHFSVGSDHLIHEIDFIEGGGIWQESSGR